MKWLKKLFQRKPKQPKPCEHGFTIREIFDSHLENRDPKCQRCGEAVDVMGMPADEVERRIRELAA